MLTVGMSVVSARAAEPLATGEFVNRVYQDDQGSHKYVVFVPRGYTADKAWPAILWLHGASARGRDGRTQLVAGLGPNVYLRRNEFPFLVVFPQCENLRSRLLGGWTEEDDDANRALRILAEAEQHYRIDPARRVLAGVSMGAFGVWSVAARTPELWSALVPVSGGGPMSLTEQLNGIPVWAFHAADDQVVPPVASSSLVDAIRDRGGRAYYSELPDGGHNIGSRVFAKDEIYEWLLDPRTTPRHPTEWTQQTEAVPQLQNEVPFVPGAEISRAMQVHVGADLLEAFASSLPKQVPPEAMQGARGPQAQETGSGFTRFQVTVAGVQYAGQVRSARLEPLEDNQLRLRFGVQPLTMTILGTEIQGRLLRAQAGPMQAVIGVQRPAWLNVVVRPRIEARQLKVDLVSADFTIEADNWYVTEPNGVDVFPLPMMRDRISQRLTDGLYAKRGEIEQQVVAGVPKLLEQVETRVQAQLDRVVTFGRWPMPVWQPRAKFWPNNVTIDSRGLTVSLGMTLAALAPQSDTLPLRVHDGPSVAPERSEEGLQISVTSDVVRSWTELLASSEVRRFHVQDFHSPAFKRLGEREFLSQVMPDLIDRNHQTELRSVLSFEQPMYLEPTSREQQAAPDPQPISLDTRSSKVRLGGGELRLTVSERKQRTDAWTPLAEFPIAWSQDFSLTTKKVSHRRRTIVMESLSSPQVETFGKSLVESGKPQPRLNQALIEEQFRRGWESTFSSAFARQIQLPERVIAEVPLVCERVGLEGDYLVIRLAKPTTQIRNISPGELTYEVRAGDSAWSEPQVLRPGMMHEYRTAGPLTWRSRNTQAEFVYTLPLGSVSHYRGGATQPLWIVPDKAAADVAQQPGTQPR